MPNNSEEDVCRASQTRKSLAGLERTGVYYASPVQPVGDTTAGSLFPFMLP